MKRKEFLNQLKRELSKRRDIELEEVIFYYDELIQDAIDSGENEEIFIINLGSIKDIVRRLEDDESFMTEVKITNKNAIEKTIGLSVKIIAYFFIGLIGFIIAVTGFSVFVSGVAIVFAIIVRLIYIQDIDTYGYLANLGLVMIGISLSLASVALVKWHFTGFKPALLSMFRKTNRLLNRRGLKTV
jgi:uncharacterized membrane protein